VSVSLSRRILPCLLGAGLVAACSDSSGPTGGSQGTLSFTTGTGAPALAAALHPMYSAGPISANGQTLDLSKVELVLAEVELKQADHSGLCSGEGPGCEEFEAGPVLVDLPLGGGVISPLSSPVAAGTYSEAELKVDIPSEDDASTTAFLAAHPTWPDTASVHVVGTFDANDGAGPQAFDVYIATEAELELGFNPPVVVDASGAFNVTVAIDPNAWFTAGDGSLIDPRLLATDSSLNEAVKANIDSSFHAFDDDNKDGVED
jgi:hypothetical protein